MPSGSNWRCSYRNSRLLRLSDFLAEARAERRAIECELAAVLAGTRGSTTDE
jgi:hypothetical protein